MSAALKERPRIDHYAYWRAKLAGMDPDPPEDRTQLPCGFWRMQRGEPLAVWIHGGRRIAMIGFNGSDRIMTVNRMETIAEQGGFGVAVTEEAYRAAFAAGRWPDTDPVVAEQTGAGHNAGSDVDALRDQIEAAKAGAGDYATIADDETAARAQSLRSRLLELSGEADKKRTAEKQPHLEAGKAVDAEWMPLVKDAKAAADTIRNALSRWETEKARRAAEVSARDEPGEPVPLPKETIRGGYGRTATVRTVNRASVVNADALFAAVKDRPDVQAFLAGIAQKHLDTTGELLPGVEVTQERRVS